MHFYLFKGAKKFRQRFEDMKDTVKMRALVQLPQFSTQRKAARYLRRSLGGRPVQEQIQGAANLLVSPQRKIWHT
jgi:hypothetical protein